jgi:hypothetical protein
LSCWCYYYVLALAGTQPTITLLANHTYQVAFAPELGECMPMAGFVAAMPSPPPPLSANETAAEISGMGLRVR